MKLKSLILSFCFLAITIIPAQVMAKTTFKLAASDPEDSEQGVVATVFSEYVKKHSNGEMDVEIFYSGALGDESEALRNVQQGTLPLTMVGIANLVPFEKRLGVLTLPYLFTSVEEVVAGTTGEASKFMQDIALKAGFRVLTWTYSGYRFISNSNGPITKIEDMQGLKFRIPQSAVLIASYEAFGASPTPISWAETFTALQQGVVDGQCLNYIGFKANKFNEANQKYISEVHYTYQLQPLVMSERVYRKLTPEQQQIITEAGLVAQKAVLDYQNAQNDKAKEDLIALGVTVSKLEDEEKWISAAMLKVWPEMAEFVGGQEVIDAYLKAMKGE